jgi:hypothetical protein
MKVVGGRDHALIPNRRYAAPRFHLFFLLVFSPDGSLNLNPRWPPADPLHITQRELIFMQ